MEDRIRMPLPAATPDGLPRLREDRFVSILFGPDAVAPEKQAVAPACFADLNLDRIVGDAIASRAEYDLATFLYQPLRDPAALAWRQAVFHDLEQDDVVSALTAFAAGMRQMRQSLTQAGNFADARQKQAELVAAAACYCTTVTKLAADLDTTGPTSPALCEVRDWLGIYRNGASFRALGEDAKAIRAALDEVSYSLLIDAGSVRVTRYDGQADYSIIISDVFNRFAQLEGKTGAWKFPDFVEMNHVEAGILDRVTWLFPEPFERLERFAARWEDFVDPVLSRFDRELQFYLAWRDYIAPLHEAGLPLCLPHVSVTSKEEQATGAYDIALARKLVAEGGTVVTNDFRLVGAERIFVVTGPNQGGKTTFARMIGQMHWLAALGLPVPGKAVRLFLFDRLLSHFERQETVATERGKLEDEVFRIHEILRSATPDSLVVINEIFASTSLEDAVSLATKVMRQIVDLGCLAVCVTFLDEISRLGPSVVSCMSAVVPDNPAKRTFHIERRDADGMAYAISLAKRHGLTKQQILERIGT